MNLKEYLIQKEIAQERASKNIRQRVICLQCLRPKSPTMACLCPGITPFKTNTEFRILMHPKEAKKEPIGTGRYSNFALENSKIIIDATFDNNREVQSILNDNSYMSYLLYPGEDAIDLSNENFEIPSDKKLLIFIIDGTWSCAKSMMRDSKCLHHLPRLSFSVNKESRFRIKHQPAKYCLSTIESLFYLISELENQRLENCGDKKNVLIETLDKMVDFQIACANDPDRKGYRKKPFKGQKHRSEIKRWEYRKICFEEKNYD